jgi:hypothetical protein
MRSSRRLILSSVSGVAAKNSSGCCRLNIFIPQPALLFSESMAAATCVPCWLAQSGGHAY